MKVYLFIIMAIVGISLTSAIELQVGENQTIEFNLPISYCNFTNNNSNLDGINYTINGKVVTIITEHNYFPDNLSIECYTNDYVKPVVSNSESNSGSSSGGVIIKDWSARCGYNKECLYGTLNETNETILVKNEIVEEVVEPIITEDKETPMGAIIMVAIFGMVGIGLVVFLIWKICKPKEPSEYYDNSQKGGTSENGI